MPDVSVIIPIYNVERWLPACLDSVLAQTFQDFEVICVNDCSYDGCAAILADYAVRDPRIRIIELEQNSGQGIARNVGFKASKGRYAYFLDSDDMIAPETLEELVACADENNLDGIFFDSSVVFDSPELAKRHASYPAHHIGSYPVGVMQGIDLFESFMGQHDWTCYVQRQLWRSAFLRENNIVYPSKPTHEDEAFAFEAIVRSKRVMYLPRPLFIRRYRDGSVMTSKPGLKDFISYFQGLCHMLQVSSELDLDSRGVKSNIARIFFACKRLYEHLRREGIDPGAQFADEPDLYNRYLVFASSQDFVLHYGLLSPYIGEQIARYERLYIYGAGIIASNVFDVLASGGQAIEGFLVTSKADNPPAYKGHHVYELAKTPCDHNALVLVAVTDGYRTDVEQALDSAGWHHVYFKDGRV